MYFRATKAIVFVQKQMNQSVKFEHSLIRVRITALPDCMMQEIRDLEQLSQVCAFPIKVEQNELYQAEKIQAQNSVLCILRGIREDLSCKHQRLCVHKIRLLPDQDPE